MSPHVRDLLPPLSNASSSWLIHRLRTTVGARSLRPQGGTFSISTNCNSESSAIQITSTRTKIGVCFSNSRPTTITNMTRPFSTAAPPVSRRSTAAVRKAPITVTERAAARIQEILSAKKDTLIVGIRLGVKRRGCNGYSYTLNYVHSPTEFPKDEIVQAPQNVTIFVDPMALFSIVGTTMDWVDTELSSEFTFENPNSKGECGCGESFTV